MTRAIERPVRTSPRGGRWIRHWAPDDPDFWATTGKAIATRNLVVSIVAEHIGFSIWSVWSVIVLFMGPEYGFSPADKFALVCVPTAVGALMRIPYALAVPRFGGRNWTMVSAILLLVPTLLLAAVLHPGTSLGTFLVIAALGGVGGGNFASSMANINILYPRSRKGWALGLNAGGGNLGVAVIQLVGLLVLTVGGATRPHLLLWIYLPLIVLSVLGAALFMDNIDTPRGGTGAMREVMKDPHTWAISALYIGTFGSFIGFGFAFGLVLQFQFGRTPLQAASLTFLGPLVGSLVRPLGGLLSDRHGGARVTAATFTAMVAGCGLVIASSAAGSLAMFEAGFVALFALSGIGNGSTYRMIPGLFPHARLSGAVIGVTGAIGALGGLFVNLAFRQSFLATGSGVPAFTGFLIYYLACLALTWAIYLHPVPTKGISRANRV